MSVIVNLPYPVSNNRNARMVNGRMISSKEARQYKTEAAWLAKASGCKVNKGKVKLTVQLHPKQNKNGSASKTLIDLDNAFKCVCDALNGVAWVDDSQVVQLYAEVSNPIKGGGLTVVIDDYVKVDIE